MKNLTSGRSRRWLVSFLLSATALALGGPLRAQGEFVNFEVPQIAPIAIATVGGASYVLVCNTPDNSVEVYDAATKELIAGGRVPVGLSPVTVRWHNGRFYTCNFMGDSVSVVRLQQIDGSVKAVLERTVHVGDEPTDILFDGVKAIVSLHSGSSVVEVDPLTIAALDPQDPETVLVHDPPLGGTKMGVKAPRRLALLSGGRLAALNTKGGNRDTKYDFDLYVDDGSSIFQVGKMGSTNTGMAYDPVGERLLVVGGKALNNDFSSVFEARDAEFGFVESWLWVVDTASSPPTVVIEQDANGGNAPWRSINLNRDYTFNGEKALEPKSDRVSQPMDVILTGGATQRVVIANFGSDEVMVLTQDSNQNGGWSRTHVDIAPFAGYGASGPRGLAYDGVNDLVWVMCRLSNAIAAFDPDQANPTVYRIRLSNDPTPSVIRENRKFLYSAHLTSGEEMVACASCHVDGRTDGLAWNIGIKPDVVTAVPDLLIDEVPEDYPKTAAVQFHGFSPFHSDKGKFVTQTLQGLVNSHIESDASPLQSSDLQYVTTNAPYHWRGDKPDFTDFNEAFVRLQDMPDMGGVTGLDPLDMEAYRTFIETIHYPPNPEQPLSRVYDGELGQPDLLDDGSGALYGMKLYHLAPSIGVQACVTCHTLPEGSANTFVLSESGPFSPRDPNPLETAQIRGLFQREKALVEDFDVTANTDWTRLADFGLMRDGVGQILGQGTPTDERSINDFNSVFNLIGASEPIVTQPQVDRLAALNEFCRQFDWGVAPMIGQVVTKEFNKPIDTFLLDQMRQSAREANSGIAVYVRRDNGTKVQGYYYDCATPLPSHKYTSVSGNSELTESELLGLVQTQNDLVVFQAVPTGSERRIAHRKGNPNNTRGVPARNLTLLPMVPNTAFERITELENDPGLGTVAVNPTPPLVTGRFMLSIDQREALEDVLRGIQGVGGQGAGVGSELRNEPPRRLRVSGEKIRHGAKLRLGMMVGDPLTFVLGQPIPTKWLVMDLAATTHRDALGQVVWETAEELDPRMTMIFLAGGPEIDQVKALLDDDPSDADKNALASLHQTWNGGESKMFFVQVINDDGVPGGKIAAISDMQQLTIADQR